MKYVSIILLSLLLFSCKKEKSKNDWGKMKLYGKVKMLTEITYDLIDTSVAHPNKKYRWKHTFKFGPQGLLLERCEYDNADDTEATTKRIYEYDTAGHPEQELLYVRNELVGKIKYLYNDKGEILSSKKLKANDSIESIVWYKYSVMHLMREATYYSPPKKVIRHELYDYDQHKRKSECVMTDADSFRQKTVYQYDDDGNLLSEISDTAKRYQEARVIHKYDKDGNEIEETAYGLDKSLHTQKKMSYKNIDKTGNWLGQTIYWKDLRPTLIERTIIYY